MAAILVTGGAGFIGHHLCKALLERGDEVIIVDNLNDYYDPAIKKERITILQKDHDKKLVFHKVDISNFEALHIVFTNHKIKKIVHLAAQAGVRYSIEHPQKFEQSNGVGTINLLELARQHKVKHFIFASSSSVYSGNKKVPFEETDRVENPTSLYAATKRYNELKARIYSQLFGIKCIALRYFTVYGPHERPDKALPIWTHAIHHGEEVRLHNNGNMLRDFTYVDDIIQGTLAAIDKIDEFEFEIFNLARGETVEIIDYLKAVEKHVGKKAKIKNHPMGQGEALVTSGEIKKAKNLLGYKPKTSIDEGVRKYVEWHKEYYDLK